MNVKIKSINSPQNIKFSPINETTVIQITLSGLENKPPLKAYLKPSDLALT